MIDGNNSHILPEEWVTRHEPVDDIEPRILPADELRHARVEAIRLLNALGNAVERSNPQGNVAVAFWGAAYGLGLNCCDGMTMTERAQSLGVGRATISKGATSFCGANNLPPSYYMKTDGAGAVYSKVRIEVVIASSNGNGSNEAEQ